MSIDPKIELFIKELLEKERGHSNTYYAIKLVEKIVFSILGLAGVAIVVALLRQIGL